MVILEDHHSIIESHWNILSKSMQGLFYICKELVGYFVENGLHRGKGGSREPR